MKKTRFTILNLFGIKSLGETDTIQKKLHDGFDVNTVDSGGRSILQEAVIQKNHDLIKLLLEHGADVNLQCERNWTALHFAAQNYDLVASKLLIQNGANVNAQDDYGNSVISKAVFNCRNNGGELIKLLLENGADINVRNQSGISALDLAKTISNYNVIQYLG